MQSLAKPCKALQSPAKHCKAQQLRALQSIAKHCKLHHKALRSKAITNARTCLYNAPASFTGVPLVRLRYAVHGHMEHIATSPTNNTQCAANQSCRKLESAKCTPFTTYYNKTPQCQAGSKQSLSIQSY